MERSLTSGWRILVVFALLSCCISIIIADEHPNNDNTNQTASVKEEEDRSAKCKSIHLK